MRDVSRVAARGARKVAVGVGLALVCAGLLASGVEARAFAADAPTDSTKTPADGAKPAKKSKASNPKAKAKAKKKKDAAPPSDDAGTTAARRRKIGAPPAYVVGDSDAHLINQDAPPLVPFGGEAGAVKKAFAETRRDQLVDAEKAARDATSPDRWRTVLFMLRGLPERTDPEACFWRVLSFYRLGEIQRARVLRENCELPSKDSATLNAEDATASGVPQMGTVAIDDGFGPPPGGGTKTDASMTTPTPAVSPYAGPGPQRH